MTLAKNGMTPKAISRLVGEHDTRIWRVLEHYVEASRAKEDFSSVSMVGVDETSRAKGHQFVTLFADMDKRKVIFATEGKDHTTIDSFRQDLEEHGGDALKITDFSIDMSKAFIKGIVEKFENAAITFDKFHVIKIINDAVDEVRRAEQRVCPELKRTRYVWLKNEDNHNDNQRKVYEELKDSTLKTARACRIKDMLQKLYEQPAEDAPAYLKRCRLTPIIKAAKTIKAHWDGVMRWFHSGLNNGFMEGINSLVQAAKARARGYRSTKKMKVMM